MRADYLDRYADALHRRPSAADEDGAWFRNAAYPYLNTITCAGHSTIGTGTLPYRHGMILNAWYDRKTGKAVDCTDDPTQHEISYGELSGTGDSARTDADADARRDDRDRQHGHVVTMSIKARSAIGLAGHGGDIVLWFDDARRLGNVDRLHADADTVHSQYIERQPGRPPTTGRRGSARCEASALSRQRR